VTGSYVYEGKNGQLQRKTQDTWSWSCVDSLKSVLVSIAAALASLVVVLRVRMKTSTETHGATNNTGFKESRHD
jgi:hypothetical protein